MSTINKALVSDFIEQIWNRNQFDKLGNYLHPEFKDHSLPPALTPDENGLRQWIIGTGKSFEHTTIMEQMLAEGDKVMVKIRMELKHIGVWRDIEAHGALVTTVGYRYFELADSKIIAHWGLIDGNTIENQLKETHKGCKVQV